MAVTSALQAIGDTSRAVYPKAGLEWSAVTVARKVTHRLHDMEYTFVGRLHAAAGEPSMASIFTLPGSDRTGNHGGGGTRASMLSAE